MAAGETGTGVDFDSDDLVSFSAFAGSELRVSILSAGGTVSFVASLTTGLNVGTGAGVDPKENPALAPAPAPALVVTAGPLVGWLIVGVENDDVPKLNPSEGFAGGVVATALAAAEPKMDKPAALVGAGDEAEVAAVVVADPPSPNPPNPKAEVVGALLVAAAAAAAATFS